MQIATDPVPLLHDRVLGSLLMQSCIVDRDGHPLEVAHPARDEALEPIVSAHDAEGRVACANERPDSLDDELECFLNVEQSGDRTGGLVDGIQRGCVERLIGTDPGRMTRSHGCEPSSVAPAFGTSGPHVARRPDVTKVLLRYGSWALWPALWGPSALPTRPGERRTSPGGPAR